MSRLNQALKAAGVASGLVFLLALGSVQFTVGPSAANGWVNISFITAQADEDRRVARRTARRTTSRQTCGSSWC